MVHKAHIVYSEEGDVLPSHDVDLHKFSATFNNDFGVEIPNAFMWFQVKAGEQKDDWSFIFGRETSAELFINGKSVKKFIFTSFPSRQKGDTGKFLLERGRNDIRVEFEKGNKAVQFSLYLDLKIPDQPLPSPTDEQLSSIQIRGDLISSDITTTSKNLVSSIFTDLQSNESITGNLKVRIRATSHGSVGGLFGTSLASITFNGNSVDVFRFEDAEFGQWKTSNSKISLKKENKLIVVGDFGHDNMTFAVDVLIDKVKSSKNRNVKLSHTSTVTKDDFVENIIDETDELLDNFGKFFSSPMGIVLVLGLGGILILSLSGGARGMALSGAKRGIKRLRR